MNRKKRLRFIQIGLLLVGFLIIFFTYTVDNNNSKNLIITKETQDKILELSKKSNQGDIFYNVEYSGLDLAGNRYILKSKEAINSKLNKEIVNMKFVRATFYFKNDKILYVTSDAGIYNNQSLDMIFSDNIKANYEESELFAEKAEYSNKNSYLTISENVKINDIRGTVFADKLFFDIKKQTVDIASFDDGKINANINLK
jgi:hypothetical protein